MAIFPRAHRGASAHPRPGTAERDHSFMRTSLAGAGSIDQAIHAASMGECVTDVVEPVQPPIVRTARKRTSPLSIRPYASVTRLSGNFSIMGCTSLKAL